MWRRLAGGCRCILFPLDYLRLGGFALLAAVLAALWPAR
jgi:hypothetical protein